MLPGWLAALCAVAVIFVAIYLLFVILLPEKF